MNNPKLYTVKEAAKLVGVSTNTLYKYLDENKIKAARGSAIQGRFRIPESALEEFLGIKLSEPEPVGATFTVARTGEPTIPESHEQVQDLPLPKNHLPLRLARILLLLALFAVLLDVFISRSISLPGQISRLLFLFVMLLLAYQEGGYRRG
ncbi:MAG: helix-turn-helix domain-containing protein [Microgenomates group bacterium]